jgi:hypothetical protein
MASAPLVRRFVSDVLHDLHCIFCQVRDQDRNLLLLLFSFSQTRGFPQFADLLLELAQPLVKVRIERIVLRNRVALIVPGQGNDTTASNPAATQQLNILAAIAQFERELIRERVIAGIGRPKAVACVSGDRAQRSSIQARR